MKKMKMMFEMATFLVFCFVALEVLAYFKASHDPMPTFLEPLKAEFVAECDKAEWNQDMGLTDSKSLLKRLNTIVERRDALLKQRGVKKINAEWTIEYYHNGEGVVKPHAHFLGWYLD